MPTSNGITSRMLRAAAWALGGVILVLTLWVGALAMGDELPAALAAPPIAAAPAVTSSPQADQPPTNIEPSFVPGDAYQWQVLPAGVIYHSYLAGTKEPRFASQFEYIRGQGWNWDTVLGGRVALIRYGTEDSSHPQGWEFDMAGATFPRLNLERAEQVTSNDYNISAPLTYGYGNYQMKFSYYHICSHLGDWYLVDNPNVSPDKYVRNAFQWGHSYYWTDDLRLYGEAGWAFACNGGAEPWEFQFGIEYSPARPTGFRPVPFFAINSDLRQELNFGGNVCVETGYQWRGPTNHLFRIGLQYFAGKSDQYEFYDQYEERVGMGLWFDY